MKKYYASLDGETFNIGPTNVRALAYGFGLDALEKNGEKDAPVWVGERVDFIPHIDIGNLLESLREDAFEHCGESADGWPSLTAKQEKSLGEMLNCVLSIYLETFGEKPEFFGIKDVEKISDPLNKQKD